MRHKSDASQRRWKDQKSRGPTTTRFSISASVLFYIYIFKIWRGDGPLALPLPVPLLLFWKKRARLKRAWSALTSYRVNHNFVLPPTKKGQ